MDNININDLLHKLLVVERLKLLIHAMLTGRSNRLNYTALHLTLLSFGLCTILNYFNTSVNIILREARTLDPRNAITTL